MTNLFKPRFSWVTILVVATLVMAISSGVTIAIIFSFVSPRTINQPSSTPPTVTPIRDDNVAALGRLEPQGEVVNLSAPAFIEGARVEQLLVKLGDEVKKGQIIAILDSRDRLQAALEKAQSQVKVAQTRLEQVKIGAKEGTIQAQQATIERTEAELKGQMTAQQATIQRIKAELNHAKVECGRYQKLYQDGATSASERDNQCTKEAVFQEQLQEVEATRNRTIETLLKQLTEAKATLEEIAEVRPSDVAVAQAELAEATVGVQQAKANLNLAYVRSPNDGQILKIHTFPGEMVAEEGIVALGKTQNMYAIAEVYETEINQVQVGQSAIITSKGFSGQLQGTVEEIGLQIGKKDVLSTDPAADVDARVVEVKIRLDSVSSQKVKGLTNLQVNVVISH